MGKRKDKDTSTDDEMNDSEQIQQKKHKKHKHKRHRKKKCTEESEASPDLSFDDADHNKHSFKLKIKFPPGDKSSNHSMGDKSKEKGAVAKLGDKAVQASTPSKPPSKKKRGKGKDSGTSSEEERWLDAIESGKLEEVDDELKKIKPKDPKLMTARQRAMFERKSDKEPSPGGEQLMALPSGYKEKIMTAESIQKAALKSQKRKQLADEKREKDKKKTMDRLLKKQESKSGKACNRSRSARKNVPRVTYLNNMEGISISLPPSMPFPLQADVVTSYPPVLRCGVQSCTNRKKYCCSQTGIPLCSLGCYNKNLKTGTSSGRGS